MLPDPSTYLVLTHWHWDHLFGQTVANLGNNRDRILVMLPETLGAPLDEEQLEMIDAFLAGL